MSRPFRFAPPTPQAAVVLRRPVQRVLSQRFERRATVVRAGAGFGKTTAVAQAFTENELAPHGLDVWLACDHRDGDAAHLAADLLVAVHRAQGSETSRPLETVMLEHLVDACRAAAPAEICVALDDIHLVAEGSTGATLVGAFIEAMPANAHVLLIGRTGPPVGLARLLATGQLAEIGESDLVLDDDDVARVLRRLGVEPDGELVERLAGWPALVRLAAESTGGVDFVWQEVIDLLTDDQRALLMALVATGEADDDLLRAVTDVERPGEVADVPLVHRSNATAPRYAAHDLWIDLLRDHPDVADLRSRAAAWLTAESRFDEAVDLALLGDLRTDAAIDALTKALRGALAGLHTPPAECLRRWFDSSPPAVREQPVGLLLEGLVLRLDNPGGDPCRAKLQAAADGFIALADRPSAVGALGALAFAHHVRRDGPALATVFGQLTEMAQGGTVEAVPYLTIALVALATAQSDPVAVLEHTDDLLAQALPRDVRAVALWHHVNALNNLGREAVDAAREMVAIGLPLPGLGMGWISARWRAGHIRSLLDDAELRTRDDTAGARDDFLTAVWRTVISVGVGDIDAARDAIEIVLDSDAHEAQWQTAGSVLIPRAALAYETGDIEGAAELMREMLDHHPLDSEAHGYYVNSLCLVYRLLPELRAYFDQLDGLGELYTRDLVLNQHHVTACDGDASTLASIDLPANAGELLPALGLSRSIELLCACWSADHPDAPDVLADLYDLLGERVRSRLRLAAGHPATAIAHGARDIIERIPVAPVSRTTIALFGGTDLTIDGVPSESPDWRRERVRALLTLLATHPDTTRETAIAALWPDASIEAGRRNLRSTLNVLNGVLEPNRVGGDAPYFIRSVGQRLRLVLDEHLTIDVVEFERLLDRADEDERAGAPSLAIEPLRAACALYQGDLLPDSYDDWVLFARDRLRARYVRAAVRCGELLVASGRTDEAIAIITPALAIEPWSEPGHRALVSAHLRNDDAASARRAMVTCREVLADIGGPSEQLTQMLERRLEQLA
jgi:DNA-binding SARP family transcriptional activator